ncbi:MAG TPA: hypothetical protein VLE53_13335 [Gemmatimonadaceae bacterium]|nr:hypothetical protein [Gemmatimonadaceae bacterium]
MTMKTMQRLPLVLAAASLVACSEVTTAPEVALPDAANLALQNAATSNIVPFAMGAWVSCANGGAGETVDLEGDLRFVTQTITDQHGGTFERTHVQPWGVWGMGRATGARYKGVGMTQEMQYEVPAGESRYSFVNNFRLIGKGPGNDLHIHAVTHMSTDVNGIMVASVEVQSTECH